MLWLEYLLGGMIKWQKEMQRNDTIARSVY